MSGSRLPREGEAEDNSVIEPKTVEHLNYNPFKSHVGRYPREIQLFPMELRPVLDDQERRKSDFYKEMRSRKQQEQRRRDDEQMERPAMPERRHRVPRRPRGCDESCPQMDRSSCTQGTDVYRNILGPTPDESILAGLQTVIEICGLSDVRRMETDSGNDSRLVTTSSRNSTFYSQDALSLRKSSSDTSQDDNSGSSRHRYPMDLQWYPGCRRPVRRATLNSSPSALQREPREPFRKRSREQATTLQPPQLSVSQRTSRDCSKPCPLNRPPPCPATGLPCPTGSKTCPPLPHLSGDNASTSMHCGLPKCPAPLHHVSYKYEPRREKGTFQPPLKGPADVLKQEYQSVFSIEESESGDSATPAANKPVIRMMPRVEGNRRAHSFKAQDYPAVQEAQLISPRMTTAKYNTLVKENVSRALLPQEYQTRRETHDTTHKTTATQYKTAQKGTVAKGPSRGEAPVEFHTARAGFVPTRKDSKKNYEMVHRESLPQIYASKEKLNELSSEGSQKDVQPQGSISIDYYPRRESIATMTKEVAGKYQLAKTMSKPNIFPLHDQGEISLHQRQNAFIPTKMEVAQMYQVARNLSQSKLMSHSYEETKLSGNIAAKGVPSCSTCIKPAAPVAEIRDPPPSTRAHHETPKKDDVTPNKTIGPEVEPVEAPDKSPKTKKADQQTPKCQGTKPCKMTKPVRKNDKEESVLEKSGAQEHKIPTDVSCLCAEEDEKAEKLSKVEQAPKTPEVAKPEEQSVVPTPSVVEIYEKSSTVHLSSSKYLGSKKSAKAETYGLKLKSYSRSLSTLQPFEDVKHIYAVKDSENYQPYQVQHKAHAAAHGGALEQLYQKAKEGFTVDKKESEAKYQLKHSAFATPEQLDRHDVESEDVESGTRPRLSKSVERQQPFEAVEEKASDISEGSRKQYGILSKACCPSAKARPQYHLPEENAIIPEKQKGTRDAAFVKYTQKAHSPPTREEQPFRSPGSSEVGSYTERGQQMNVKETSGVILTGEQTSETAERKEIESITQIEKPASEGILKKPGKTDKCRKVILPQEKGDVGEDKTKIPDAVDAMEHITGYGKGGCHAKKATCRDISEHVLPDLAKLDLQLYEDNSCSDKCCGSSVEHIPCMKVKSPKDVKDVTGKEGGVCLKYVPGLTAQCFPPVNLPSGQFSSGECIGDDCSCPPTFCACCDCRCVPGNRPFKRDKTGSQKSVVVQDPKNLNSSSLFDGKFICNKDYVFPSEKKVRDYRASRMSIPPAVQPVIGVCTDGKCGSGGTGEKLLQVRYSIVRISTFNDYTTYEILKSSAKKPKKLPGVVEGIFVTKR